MKNQQVFSRSLIYIALMAFCQISFGMGHIPLLDNQPSFTETCPFTNISDTIDADGNLYTRNYYCVEHDTNVVWSITIPEGCGQGGCGLILDQHGGSMNANTQNHGTQLREYGANAQAYGAARPYIVVQPSMTDLFDALGAGLDIDSLITRGPDGLPDSGGYINELPHLNSVMLQLIEAFKIDTARIHWYGFSRGARTISRVLCDRFAVDFPIASVAVGGGAIHCDLKANMPLMMINGKTDVLSGPKMEWQDEQEAFVLSQTGVQESTLHEDENWQEQFKQGFLFFKTYTGQHTHKRFKSESYVLESVRHSAQGSIPYFGHCHPRKNMDRWLVCRANFDLGEKLINFFIQNPKPMAN